MLQKQQNQQLSKDFNLCSTVQEEADIYNFVSDLADTFMGAAQYNSEISPNISDICSIMTNNSRTPYDSLRMLNGVSECCGYVFSFVSLLLVTVLVLIHVHYL